MVVWVVKRWLYFFAIKCLLFQLNLYKFVGRNGYINNVALLNS